MFHGQPEIETLDQVETVFQNCLSRKLPQLGSYLPGCHFNNNNLKEKINFFAVLPVQEGSFAVRTSFERDKTFTCSFHRRHRKYQIKGRTTNFTCSSRNFYPRGHSIHLPRNGRTKQFHVLTTMF
jgi:hypothetical protein